MISSATKTQPYEARRVATLPDPPPSASLFLSLERSAFGCFSHSLVCEV